ncbi:MAG: hypothetical protein SCK28_10300 [Bacillota bacterium]|nr:hypothetical protein [Bacillota bacterium]
MDPTKREIDWPKIFDTDFGSGHKAVLYWTFAMWAGRSWGGWEEDDGKIVPMVDVMSSSSSIGKLLCTIVHQALALRWDLT